MSFDFIEIVFYLSLLLLIWDCVEVGRNDAANLVNAVFGARIMRRRMAVMIAGVAVILGATASSDVIETARKGIFEPTFLLTMNGITAKEALRMAMTIYISVYIVDTVLLYAYSAFGMPISTTASLIFELIGASFAMAGIGIVNVEKAGLVIMAIVISIAISGIASFMIQKVFRAAIRDKGEDPQTVFLQGPWIAGAMLTWLCWFMLLKGLKNIEFVKNLKASTLDEYGTVGFLLIVWFFFYVIIHLVLTITKDRGARKLFRVTAVLGMICMAFAFGQNDLANCASPGLAAMALGHKGDVALGTSVAISRWALFACGFLIFFGMMSRNAQRVTRAAVNTGSQFDTVALWAPKWCLWAARKLLAITPQPKSLAPPPSRTERGKKVHLDTMRASVIMSVSASVIAFASGQGLPVSTTYVAFAAVFATGLADRVFVRGDRELKVGRAIWVMSSWFISALVAMVATGLVCRTIFHLGTIGVILGLAANLGVRAWAKSGAQRQDDRVHEEARKRIAASGEEDEGSENTLSEEEED